MTGTALNVIFRMSLIVRTNGSNPPGTSRLRNCASPCLPLRGTFGHPLRRRKSENPRLYQLPRGCIVSRELHPPFPRCNLNYRPQIPHTNETALYDTLDMM